MMCNIRVLYCIPSLANPGGMEKILSEKVNWLASHGYDITIITTNQGVAQPFFKLSPLVRHVDLGVDFNAHFNAPLIQKTILHRQKLKKYEKLLRGYVYKHPQDIIVSLCGKEIEFIYKMKRTCAVYAELHFSQRFKEQFLSARHNSILYRAIGKYLTYRFVKCTRRLDKLVVLTKADEQMWRKTNNNIVQIYNALPIPYVNNSGQRQKRVIAVGKLDPQKGFDMLIKAWKYVKLQMPEWHLDIFGSGELWEELQTMIAENSLCDVVKLRGRSRTIQYEMETSSIFVMSSRFEGFPMVLIEAISAGLPIVSFDCPTGPRELVVEGVSGYLVPENDIEALAERLIKLMSDSHLRESFSLATKKKYAELDFEKTMQQWDSLFHRCWTN